MTTNAEDGRGVIVRNSGLKKSGNAARACGVCLPHPAMAAATQQSRAKRCDVIVMLARCVRVHIILRETAVES